MGSLEEPITRFWRFVSPEPNSGCWLWTGAESEGHGIFSIKHRLVKAHRFSFEAFVRQIPEGLVIDHLCRVRCCVNPLHLEPVTTLVNTMRGDLPGIMRNRFKHKTHCPFGHPYSGDNLYQWGTRRACKICRVENSKRWIRKHRGSSFDDMQKSEARNAG
jgi:hypothetical protein